MASLGILDSYHVLTTMLAPALLMAATGSLLVSANARLARVVDRMRAVMSQELLADASEQAELDAQIARHRQRARLVLRACQLLYLALGAFVGTSLALAADALSPYRLPLLPTGLALVGVLCLLGASIFMWREVSLSVRSFDRELDFELGRRGR